MSSSKRMVKPVRVKLNDFLQVKSKGKIPNIVVLFQLNSKKCKWWGSNPRPSACKADAITTTPHLRSIDSHLSYLEHVRFNALVDFADDGQQKNQDHHDYDCADEL